MPIHNSDISEVFTKVADLLEIQGANPFRVRAYRNAARVVGGLGQSVSDMLDQGEDLSELPGLGKDLAGKVKEIVDTGKLTQLEELKKEVPPELTQILKIATLGPKKVSALYHELGITNIDDLKKAVRDKKVRTLDGFGEKTEQKILEEVKRFEADQGKRRIKLIEAEQRAEPLEGYLKKQKGVKRIVVAGSYRRRKETVGDLDILVTCKKGSDLMERLVEYDDVTQVVSKGKTRSTVILRSGLQVDVRVVPQVSYGAALHYFTGSKAHNIAVRKLATAKGLKINEYGVFNKKEERVAGKTEEEVYAQVDLPYIEPELREGSGETEAAKEGKLPKLIEIKDIVGDLHVHTKATDGHHDLQELAEAARERNYAYLAITDHSKRVSMAHGLDAKRLGEQIKEIDRINGKLKGIRLLKGIEVDILEDGSLDLPDDILKELDLRVCSVHYNTSLSAKKQTERIIRAMDNPYFNIFAHPTGRLINERGPYDVNMEEVIKAAEERGCFLEINAHPDRLDLSGRYCKRAKEVGVKVAISTDAHRITNLDYMRFGVDQARRGWLERDDVINTRGLKALRKLFTRK